MIAGPSEVLILADADNDPDWLALDLLAQAEHDAAAQAILVTDDAGFGRAVAAAVEARLATLARRDIAGASWRDYGAVIIVRDWDEAVGARRPHRARAPARSAPPTPRRWPPASATPAPSSSAR